jgi:signal transduction histidine kinase/tetratricopeptide (TPR) repeat protein
MLMGSTRAPEGIHLSLRVTGQDPPLTQPTASALPLPARHAAGMLALSALPLDPDSLANLLDASRKGLMDALAPLKALGLVGHDDHHTWPVCEDSRELLLNMAPDPIHAHRLLAEVLREQGAHAQVASHLLGAQDPRLLPLAGPPAIDALSDRARDLGARVALELWALHPEPKIGEPCVAALQRAGRLEDALRIGQEAGKHNPTAFHDPRLAARIARVLTDLEAPTGEVAAWLDRARAHLGEGPPPIEWLDAHTRHLVRVGAPQKAMEMVDTLRTSPPPSRLHAQECWLSLHPFLAEILAGQGQEDVAVELLQSACSQLPPPARAELEAAAGTLFWGMGNYLDAAAAFARAAQADPHSQDPGTIRWMDQAGLAHYQSGDRRQAIKAWRVTLGMAQRSELTTDVIRIQANLCRAYREVMLFRESKEAGLAARQAAQSMGSKPHLATALLNLTDLCLSTEDWDDTDRWLREVEAILTTATIIGGRSAYGRLGSKVARRRAEWAVLQNRPGAQVQVTEALQLASEEGAARDLARCQGMQALCHARAGDRTQTQLSLDQAFGPLRKAGASRVLAELRLWAARAWLAVGHTADAQHHADRVVTWADEVGHQLFQSLADGLANRARAEGSIFDQLGDTPTERLLEVAMDMARETDPATLLGRIADAALELTDADRSFVLLLPEHVGLLSDLPGVSSEPGPPQVVAARARDGVPPGAPSMAVIRSALSRGREVIVGDVSERMDLRSQKSLVDLHVRSALCVPLADRGTTLGALYVDSQRIQEEGLTTRTRFVRALASHAAVAVMHAQLLEENRHRADRAAEVAHDIRSPAAAMIMAAEDIRTTAGVDPWIAETMDEVSQMSQRIMGMATRYLDDTPPRKQAVDLGELTDRIVRMMARSARHTGRVVNFVSGDEATVMADAEDLVRALSNLLGNALKYAPKGSAIDVSVAPHNGGIRWRVRDRGPGIPPEAIHEIFDRGKQARNAVAGHGLGLAIAQRIIGEHGGELTAHNPDGGGACFEVWLPSHSGS